jgi:glycolate oxidase FAD binding subunit
MTMEATEVEEIQRIVRDSASVCVRGGGTKSVEAPGIPVLGLRRLTGVTEYSPAECVFTARAGTPLREIEDTLNAHGQYMPFDPPLTAEGATIGGTVAAGMSGAGRYRYGGVRDFLIGVRVVDGEGRLIRSGGKVVKNAAGFLLHHGVVGSLGRFGVLTEVTFKVFPQPEARRTMTVECGSVEAAFSEARRVESLRFDCESIDFDAGGTLSIRIAGNRNAIDGRSAKLAAALSTGVAGGDVFSNRGLSPQPGTVPCQGMDSACVKVAGLMNSWQKLRDHVTRAQFMCAGSVAWLYTTDVTALARALEGERLAGLVIRGPRAGARIGHLVHNEFEERVRRVLDPRNRFSAAPDSH